MVLADVQPINLQAIAVATGYLRIFSDNHGSTPLSSRVICARSAWRHPLGAPSTGVGLLLQTIVPDTSEQGLHDPGPKPVVAHLELFCVARSFQRPKGHYFEVAAGTSPWQTDRYWVCGVGFHDASYFCQSATIDLRSATCAKAIVNGQVALVLSACSQRLTPANKTKVPYSRLFKQWQLCFD